MVDMLYFILCASGLTQILIHGSIFNIIRPKEGFLGELFSCSMCIGFHVGWILTIISPYTTLFSFNELNIVTASLLACLSSFTSYVLDVVIDDSGVKFSKGG